MLFVSHWEGSSDERTTKPKGVLTVTPGYHSLNRRNWR